jgi:flagellar protein FliT
MTDGHRILAVYEDIAQLTRRMLEAARGGQWDALIELERDCGRRFAHLLSGEPQQPDDADYRNRKAALIRGILDDDAEIRLLVEPWLAQLSMLIGSSRQQSRLHDAYRPGL